MASKEQAYQALPADAEWSCSFGYPGEGGYVEFSRTATGERWEISNGRFDAVQPIEWQCVTLAKRGG